MKSKSSPFPSDKVIGPGYKEKCVDPRAVADLEQELKKPAPAMKRPRKRK